MEKEELKITLLIAGIILVFVLLVGYFSFLYLKKNKSPAFTIENMTLTDIYKNADEYGDEFCLKIKDPYLQETCLIESVNHRAREKGDPDICNEIKNSNLSNACKRTTVFDAVIITYQEESKFTGNDNIIPSNIYLCDTLTNPFDREYCKNPEKIVREGGTALLHKL